MGHFSTITGTAIDFQRGFGLSSLFDRGDLKRNGLRGELFWVTDGGRTEKYKITARFLSAANADKIVYDLAPGVDFSDTCLNIFKAMLTVLTFRIARCIPGEHTHDVERRFQQLVETRQSETRLGVFDDSLELLRELDAIARVERSKGELDSQRAGAMTRLQSWIQKFAKDFSKCRYPDKSVDVVARMERTGYQEGLFSVEDGGFTQPFLFKAEPGEETEKLRDDRGMRLSNGTVVWFDPRSYTTPREVEASKDPDRSRWSEEDCAEWDHAEAQEREAHDLAEKLYGGKWTKEQVKMFAAALDEMVFISHQFQRALTECPRSAPAEVRNPEAAAVNSDLDALGAMADALVRPEAENPLKLAEDAARSAGVKPMPECPEARLIRQYGARLGTPPRFMAETRQLSHDDILLTGFKFHGQLSELGDDPMFRAFFARQVESDARLTKGMTPGQIVEVMRAFSTTSLKY